MYKLKNSFKTIFIIFFVCFFLAAFFISASAEEEVDGLYIKGDPSIELVRQYVLSGNHVSQYVINLTFRNDGVGKTENTKVTLDDEEGYELYDEFVLDPNSEIIIIFNWSTLLTANQNLVIKYFPTTIDEGLWNPLNSGTVTITAELNGDEDNGSTPGFEITLLFLSIIIIYYFSIRKRKKKNN